MLRYLVSADYRDSIQETRPLIWLKFTQFDQNETEFLREALYRIDSQSTFSVDTGDDITQQVATKFKRFGLITKASTVSVLR